MSEYTENQLVKAIETIRGIRNEFLIKENPKMIAAFSKAVQELEVRKYGLARSIADASASASEQLQQLSDTIKGVTRVRWKLLRKDKVRIEKFTGTPRKFLGKNRIRYGVPLRIALGVLKEERRRLTELAADAPVHAPSSRTPTAARCG